VEVVTAYSLDGAAVDPEQLKKAEARARLEVAALQQKLEVGGWAWAWLGVGVIGYSGGEETKV